MTEVWQEWVKKAEEDWQVLEILAPNPNFPNVCCFMLSSVLKKMMKAILVQRQVAPEYTHNLLRIHTELDKVEPRWDADVVKLEKLTRFGVASRYPGLSIDASDVDACFAICAEIRTQALSILQTD